MKYSTAVRPSWLKKRIVTSGAVFDTKRVLRDGAVSTVCESSLCPNVNECFSKRHATFLILGSVCTRSCGFCSVSKGAPGPIDPGEPHRIIEAVRGLNLSYVIITSVTRDDLEDGGAGQFVRVICALKRFSENIRIEILVPDFNGSPPAIEEVVGARPDIIGHNIETVKRLYPLVRPGADYRRSVELLRAVKTAGPGTLVKSGMMLGFGEKEEEVVETMEDARSAGCDIFTIGQYLQPRKENLPVKRYVSPEEFDMYKRAGEGMGYKAVSSGPFVRSSYMAEELYSVVSRKL